MGKSRQTVGKRSKKCLFLGKSMTYKTTFYRNGINVG